MKFQLCLLFVFFCSCFMYAQDLSGNWNWSSADGSQVFEIELERISEKEYRGKHCAVFDNGNRIDCNSDQDSTSIIILKIAKNNFAGTIESSYEKSQGKIRIQYYPQNDVLHFNLTKNPPGIFYLPPEAILTR